MLTTCRWNHVVVIIGGRKIWGAHDFCHPVYRDNFCEQVQMQQDQNHIPASQILEIENEKPVKNATVWNV